MLINSSEFGVNKQYEVIGELYAQKLIDSKLLQELSNNIYSAHNLKDQRSAASNLHLAEYVPLESQMLVADG